MVDPALNTWLLNRPEQDQRVLHCAGANGDEKQPEYDTSNPHLNPLSVRRVLLQPKDIDWIRSDCATSGKIARDEGGNCERCGSCANDDRLDSAAREQH